MVGVVRVVVVVARVVVVVARVVVVVARVVVLVVVVVTGGGVCNTAASVACTEITFYYNFFSLFPLKFSDMEGTHSINGVGYLS